jgi:hypothetical protein
MMRKLWVAIAIPMLWACGADRAADGRANETAVKSEPPTQAPENAMLAANAVARQADERSQFTSIDPPSCKLLEENIEEGGWSRRLCNGVAGYKLELTDSDLRQDIIVIPAKGDRSELGLTEIVALGAFNALGKTAEWRGADLSAPEVLIVRLGVAADPEGWKPDVSNLIVARLKPSACIVAVVPPGAGQNERARAIADRKLPACLKG